RDSGCTPAGTLKRRRQKGQWEHLKLALTLSGAARDVTVGGITPRCRVQRRSAVDSKLVAANCGQLGAKVELVQPRRIVAEDRALPRAGRRTEGREAVLVHHIGWDFEPA